MNPILKYIVEEFLWGYDGDWPGELPDFRPLPQYINSCHREKVRRNQTHKASTNSDSSWDSLIVPYFLTLVLKTAKALTRLLLLCGFIVRRPVDIWSGFALQISTKCNSIDRLICNIATTNRQFAGAKAKHEDDKAAGVGDCEVDVTDLLTNIGITEKGKFATSSVCRSGIMLVVKRTRLLQMGHKCNGYWNLWIVAK